MRPLRKKFLIQLQVLCLLLYLNLFFLKFSGGSKENIGKKRVKKNLNRNKGDTQIWTQFFLQLKCYLGTDVVLVFLLRNCNIFHSFFLVFLFLTLNKYVLAVKILFRNLGTIALVFKLPCILFSQIYQMFQRFFELLQKLLSKGRLITN